LLTSLLLMVTSVTCTIMDEEKEYEALLPFFLGKFKEPDELFGMIVEDLCSTYLSIRPSTDEELKSFKKEFIDFITDSNSNENLLDEVLSATSSKYKIVPDKLKQLKKIAKKEFKALSEEERNHVKDLTGYIWHKILVQSSLRVDAKTRTNDSELPSFEKRKEMGEKLKKKISDRAKRAQKGGEDMAEVGTGLPGLAEEVLTRDIHLEL
ncbi:hypothetical protein PENTCL1PPCAC_5723, partial [Pristionchus entomophagus]